MEKAVYEKLKAKKDEEAAMTGAIQPDPVQCKTCLHVAEGELGPYKGFCDMYLDDKPKDVLFDGKNCDFYEER